MYKPETLAAECEQAPIMLPPTLKEIGAMMDKIHALLFPTDTPDKAAIIRQLDALTDDTSALIAHALSAYKHNNPTQSRNAPDAVDASKQLSMALPAIRRKALADIHAALRGDPAARDAAEVIRYYPGFRAITAHRIAHVLCLLHVPYIPRGIAERAHSETGVDIHPGATIGDALFIDHGTGVVIGETTHIGNDVKIYQGVTLGALSLPKNNLDKSVTGSKRHPTVEDRVTMYANATILGGNTVIGHDSVIGAGTWLKESIPPYSRVGTDPRIIIKTTQPLPQ